MAFGMASQAPNSPEFSVSELAQSVRRTLEELGPRADGDPLLVEDGMVGMALAAARIAYARALEALDDELCRSLPAGARIMPLGFRLARTLP